MTPPYTTMSNIQTELRSMAARTQQKDVANVLREAADEIDDLHTIRQGLLVVINHVHGDLVKARTHARLAEEDISNALNRLAAFTPGHEEKSSMLL